MPKIEKAEWWIGTSFAQADGIARFLAEKFNCGITYESIGEEDIRGRSPKCIAKVELPDGEIVKFDNYGTQLAAGS